MATGRPPGRPAKPVEKKRAEGNKGHRKLPEASLDVKELTDLPEPPPHLSEETAEMWTRIWDGGRKWMVPERDFLTVTLLCDTWEQYIRLRRQLKLGAEAGGVDPWIYTEKGYPVPHPAVSQMKQAKVEMNTYLSTLGLSPSDFARLQIAEMDQSEAEKIAMLLGGGRKAQRDAILDG